MEQLVNHLLNVVIFKRLYGFFVLGALHFDFIHKSPIWLFFLFLFRLLWHGWFFLWNLDARFLILNNANIFGVNKGKLGLAGLLK